MSQTQYKTLMSNLLNEKHAITFFCCSWGVLGSGESVFWDITLSLSLFCFFLDFFDDDDGDRFVVINSFL